MGDGPIDHPVAPPAEGLPLGPPDLLRGGPQLIPRPPDWQLGADPPWAGLGHIARAVTIDQVRAAFDDWNGPRALPRVVGEGDQAEQPSAVLAPIYDLGGSAHILLTRRSWNLRSHRGEVSFPGGRREPTDPDLVATALRETREEVGIEPAEVEVIGQLDPLMTVSSRAFIATFVGLLRARPTVVPDPREVEEVRHVALSELLSDGVYHQEIWRRDGREMPLHFFELHGDTVWGATATMLHQILARITGTAGQPN